MANADTFLYNLTNSKKSVVLNQNGEKNRVMKYIGGDSIVYKNIYVQNENALDYYGHIYEDGHILNLESENINLGGNLEVSGNATFLNNVIISPNKQIFMNPVAINDNPIINQGNNSIAIGSNAGLKNQGTNSIALGTNAGYSGQHQNTIILNASDITLNSTTQFSSYIKPIRNGTSTNILYYDSNNGELLYNIPPSGNIPSGVLTGDYLYWDSVNSSYQVGSNQVKLGGNSGQINQGINSVAIGYKAGQTNQHPSTIVLNASGTELNSITQNSFYVSNIRNDTASNLNSLNYNSTSKEISYKSINFAQLYNTAGITITQNSITPLIYNSIGDSAGISYNGANITFSQVGIYKIGTSILFAESGGSGAEAYFWFNRNENPIPDSSSVAFLAGNNKRTLAYAEIIFSINNTSDTISISAFSNDSGITAPAVSSPALGVPASPSIITTVIQIS